MNKDIVTLEKVQNDEHTKFLSDMRKSFSVAIIETFGSLIEELIPPKEDIEESLRNPDFDAFHIMLNGKKSGGVIVKIDEITYHNELDLLFINKGEDSRGLGYKAWKAIEEKYPETKVWETCTPYFEKRNINFYVNKCGFKIVEFLNEYHHSTEMPGDEELPGGAEFFVFEKVMK